MGALLIKIMQGNKIYILYMCKEESGVILSESALINLGLLPETFPNQEATSQSTAPSTECHCPKRTATPP